MHVALECANDRRSVRRFVSVPCEVVAEQPFRRISNQCLDLSPHGMLVATDVELSIGGSVVASFRDPLGATWFDTEARIVRIVEARRDSDWARAAALEFTTLDEATRALLQLTLRGYPPPIPARELRVDYATAIRRIAHI